LLAVLIFSVITGWNRKMIPQGGEEESEEYNISDPK
jgi:hypothetical protein